MSDNPFGCGEDDGYFGPAPRTIRTLGGCPSPVEGGYTPISGVGVPTGGTTDQVLAKKSNQNFDLIWKTVTGGSGNELTLADLTWTNVSDKPTLFDPVEHTHAIDNVTGLQTALDAKQPVGSYSLTTHDHIGVYAPVAHTHAIADVVGLQAAIDSKQAAGSYAAAIHSHVIADVTGLQNALDAKVDDSQVAAFGLTLLGTATATAAKTALAYIKDDVGLSNVDNTSDINKPVSTAQQTALNLKINNSLIGAANGLAPLDASSKIASSYLPSYVDDVIEAANFAALPVTGETGKIYVTSDNNKPYRWSGSAYIEISASPGSTDAVAEGSINLYFTNARAKSAAVYDAITDGVIDIAPSQNAVFDALAGKAALAHTHVIADTTGLQTALDSKATLSSINTFSVAAGASYLATFTNSSGNVGIRVVTGINSNLSNPQINISDGTLSAGMSISSSGLMQLGSYSNVDVLLMRQNAERARLTSTGVTVQGSLAATGAVSGSNLSGTNTGDQDLSGYALTSHNHSGIYQPLDAQLTSLAGLDWTANAGKVIKVNAGATGFELAVDATGGGGLADADYGDITVSGGATVLTIDPGVVTLAKMANLSANSFLGNNTGVGATPIAMTVAQAKTLLALVKADVGLGNVDNTSDAAKPVSTAQQTALDLKLDDSQASAFGLSLLDDADAATARTTLGLGSAATTSSGDYATAGHNHAGVYQPADATLTALAGLDNTAGLLEQTGADTFVRRALGVTASTSVLTRADGDGRYALAAHTHAIADVTGLQAALDAKLDDSQAGTFGLTLLGSATVAAAKTSLAYVKGDVGLGSVDNTADTAKPVSTAQQTALDLKRNKAPSIQSVTSSATVTPTFADDQVNITAQNVNLTLANPTGTAVDGWGIAIRIYASSTRTLSFGTQYRAIGVTLPTGITLAKTLYIGMVYNAADTKWDVMAVAQEA